MNAVVLPEDFSPVFWGSLFIGPCMGGAKSSGTESLLPSLLPFPIPIMVPLLGLVMMVTVGLSHSMLSFRVGRMVNGLSIKVRNVSLVEHTGLTMLRNVMAAV